MRWRTKVIKYYCKGLHLRWLRGFWLLQRFWLSLYCSFIQRIESILLQLRCMSCGSEGSAINTKIRWSLWHILDNMLFRCFLVLTTLGNARYDFKCWIIGRRSNISDILWELFTCYDVIVLVMVGKKTNL